MTTMPRMFGFRSLALAVLLVSPPTAAAAPGQDASAQREAEVQVEAVTQVSENLPSANVSIDVTVRESVGGATKSRDVHLTVAEGQFGRIRSQVERVPLDRPAESFQLFVDASPRLLQDGRIYIELSLQIGIPDPSTDPANGRVKLSITDSLTVILEEGEPMVVAQSADTLTDLKVEVEVTATVLR